jgi:hypothetical protein
VQEEVKVRGKDKAGGWVVQVRGQARARAASAFVRSVEQERRTREEPLVLNMSALSAGQR